jgi:hypothetical protein
MKYIIYLTLLVTTAANAHCRVANDNIVCDNSNTLIETYNAIIRPQQIPVEIFIVNQPIYFPRIESNYNFDLLQERVFEVRPVR